MYIDQQIRVAGQHHLKSTLQFVGDHSSQLILQTHSAAVGPCCVRMHHLFLPQQGPHTRSAPPLQASRRRSASPPAAWRRLGALADHAQEASSGIQLGKRFFNPIGVFFFVILLSRGYIHDQLPNGRPLKMALLLHVVQAFMEKVIV